MSRFFGGWSDRQNDGLGEFFVNCLFEDFERLERFAGIQIVAVLDFRQDPVTIDRRLSKD
ncbi:MAG TPA: hypothetical protein VM260_04985 [Pirellula sp.]|nr:hypothetical protein [Pirellula sp.]